MWRDGGGASKLTHRRLQILIDRLPHESATKTELRDQMDPAGLAAAAKAPRDGHGPLSVTDYLIMAALDRLDSLWHAVVVMNGGTAQMPKQYPRPGLHEAESNLDPNAVALIEHMRAQHRQVQAEEATQQG